MFGFHPPMGDSGDGDPNTPQPTGAHHRSYCPCGCHFTESGDLAMAVRHRFLAEQREQPERVGRFAEEVFVAAQAVQRRVSLGVLGPPVTDATAAVLSCPRCDGLHATIFSGRPPEIGGRAPRAVSVEPWRDSDSPVVLPPPRESDSGGTTDGSEGAE